MVDFLLNALSVLLELIIYAVFFHYFLGKPRFSRWGMALCYLLAAVVSQYLSVGNIPDWLHRDGYLAIIVALAFCYQGQFFIKLFVPFLFQIISIMVEGCYVMLLTPMRMALEVYGDKGDYFHYLTGIILSNLTILLLVRLLSSWKDYAFIKRRDITFPVYFILLFLFPIGMMFIIDQYALAVSQAGLLDFFAAVPMLLLTAMTVAFFFLFDGMLRAMQTRQQLELLHRQLEQEQQYHTVLLNKHQQFQKLRHDMRENFSSIAGLIKNGHSEEALEFAEQQSGQLALTAAVQTGHPLLDTILTLKEEQARQQDTQLQGCVSANLDLAAVDINDLASLCSNLLNNALEAVSQIMQTEQRKIWYQLTQRKGDLYFTVRNTTAGPVHIIHNSVATTKADKALHGFGLTILKGIVEKYEGSYQLQWEDNIFAVNIVLPITIRCDTERL